MPTERRAIRCSHCKNEGHNITRCKIHKIKIYSALASGENNIINISVFRLNNIHRYFENIVKFNLLYRGLLPFVTCYNYMITYNMVNNDFVFEEHPVSHIRNLNTILPNIGPTEYSDISIKIKKKYEEKMKYFKENAIFSPYIMFDDLNDLFNNDHIEVTTRLNNEHNARMTEHRRQQREREQGVLERNTEANTIINRRVLPILRTDEIAADECPICMETIGETNKTVLRCGHSLCTGCLLTQTLRASALKTVSSCFCTICRAPYL